MAAMTFKEFSAWANARACDGEWGSALATDCIVVESIVRGVPFWRRKKAWATICAQERHKAQNVPR